MAKDTHKTGPRVRRTLLRREGAVPSLISRLLESPNVGWAVMIALIFVVVCGTLAAWSRQQPLVAVGRVMSTTNLVRLGFTIEDTETTRKEQEEARQRTPRVYRADEALLAQIHASIAHLPRTLATVESVDQLAPEVARQFRLSTEALSAVRAEAVNGESSAAWLGRASRLKEALEKRPLLDDLTWQRETQGLNTQIELRVGDSSERAQASRAVNIKDEVALNEAVTAMARQAGFAEPALSAVVSRLITSPMPTFRFDETLTTERQNRAAEDVRPKMREIPVGQVIFKRGEILTQSQFALYKEELKRYQEEGERWRVWLRHMSVLAAVAAVALAASGYVVLFCPRVCRNPGRMAGLAGLLAGALAVACFGAAANPALIGMTAIAPSVFVAVLLVIAYDQRVALALSSLHGVLVCIALDQPIGIYALIVTGVGVAVWQLREVRDRRTLVRMGVISGAALAFGMILVGLIDRPLAQLSVITLLWQTVIDALWAGAGGLLTGVVALAILPSIEKWFDITTGMTLIELRDPKQPLLRQLQQRAPGTYNHSLNVASISEAAADAVGANGLLTYVGALYHDIGKMNKPDYFVENHSGGPNKHDKLSPAMSLLVIVGHVKDGMALAEEYALPRTLQHFIEAHHGTTLVEYFYTRAVKQAEATAKKDDDETDIPAEIEYRYPGPKPRTKEVAIVMLADAVESATRTLAEPTPSRIDGLVRAIANRRLMDGQFEECELTLRELQTISESISMTVASIYHGRVLYPSTSDQAGKEEKRA